MAIRSERTRWLVAGGFLAFLWSVALGAQPDRTERAPTVPDGVAKGGATVDRVFTTSDGLPSLRVREVVAASRRGTWVLTAAGIARSDGFLFRTVGAEEGLPSAELPLDLLRLPGEDNGIIAVYQHALYRRVGDRFARVPLPDSVLFSAARPAAVGGDSVFFIRRHRVLLVSDRGATDVHAQLGLGARRVSRLWSTTRGSLWLLTDGGLLHWAKGELKTRLAWNGAGLGVSVLAEAPDGRGGLFAVTQPRASRGLWEWTEERPPRRLSQEGIDEVSDIAFGDGVVALTHMYGGASVRRGRGRFEPTGGSAVGRFSSVDAGPDGTLWFGTERGLLARAPAPTPIWTQQRFAASRLANRIHEILRASDGSLWLATADGLQVISPDGRQRWIREAAGVRLNTVTGLAESPAGTIWVSSGGDFDGVSRLERGRWERDLGGGTLAGAFGHRLRVDARGDLWFLGLGRSTPYSNGPSAAAGVFRRENGKWRAFRPGGSGLEGTRVYEMDEGRDGALWFATNAGIFRFLDGQWRRWWTAQGLGPGSVFSLAADAEGGVWFAHASGRRLGRIATDGAVGYHRLPASLADAEVMALRRGPDGRVWLGADGGIAVLQRGDWIGLGSEDGLPNSSIWPVLPELESVLIGSGDGLITLNVALAEAIPVPTVRVSVRAFDRRALEARWQVGTARPDIDPAQVETRWRIDDGAWSGWSTSRLATVGGFFGGRHSFSVQSRGVLGRQGSAIRGEVVVAGPVWLSAWVLGPTLLAVAAAVAALLFWSVARRRAAAVVSRVAEAYTEIYREAPDGYLIERLPDRRIEQANIAAAALLGVPDASVLAGVPFGSLVLPESHGALDASTATLLASGRATAELRSRGGDGTERDLELTSTAVRDAAGDIVRCRTLMRDVTARKRAERELKLFRLTLDASFEPVVWLRGDGTIVDANLAFCHLVSKTQDAVIGRRFTDLWPSGAPLHTQLWGELTTHRTAHFESSLRLDVHGEVPVEVAGTLLPGHLERLAAVFMRDIRARRFDEARRREAVHEAERARREQAMGTMGRAVAHEFNNVLAAVTGFAEMLLAELDTRTVAHAHALELTQAAARGTELVAQVQAATGSRRRESTPVPFSRAVEEEVVASRASAASAGIGGLQCDLDLKARRAVRYSRRDLGRAVRNLVRNAIEASPASGGRIGIATDDVDLDAAQAGSLGLAAGRYVRLQVRDDGHGMTSEQKERAFEPFFSTRPQAFGLGLSVVRAVVEDLQGTVSLKSNLAVGTVVEVLLPAVDDTEPGSPRNAGPAPTQAPRDVAPNAGRRILFVDDEPSVLRMSGLLLSRLGYTPTLVASGREALEKLRDLPLAFDLVITDMTMPEMSGLELVRLIRATHAELPILVTSGFLDEASRRQLATFGVWGMLAKPFGRKELAAAIEVLAVTG